MSADVHAYLASAIRPDGRDQLRCGQRRYQLRRFAGEVAPRLGKPDLQQLLESLNLGRPAGLATITEDELTEFLTRSGA